MIKKERIKPYFLALIIVILDQITKIWVVRNIEENTIGYSFFSDFLYIVHVRNDAVAFSLGSELSVVIKFIFFIILPIFVMVALSYAIYSSRFDKEFNILQKWCLSGILGGGVGNLIDRIFRSFRVVDWISVKFYGLFGLERFPTWNIADSAVVCSVILLIISYIVEMKEKKNE